MNSGRLRSVAPPARKATILVVEDDPGLRELYRSTLTNAGYAVVAVEDGLDALRLIGDHGYMPSVVVLDLALPRVSGRDVMKELRAHRHTSSIHILIVSGTDTRDLDLGPFDCVLQKPVTAEQLIAAVETCLRKTPT